jgi:hypothetical protein
LISFVIGIGVSLVISRISLEGTLAIIVNWQLDSGAVRFNDSDVLRLFDRGDSQSDVD